jgi:WD40 repeat protein
LKCVWSPNGKKFAAAGGDRKVFIGYYDTKNKWWSTLSLKTLSSSITALAFHPSSKALFVGSTDFSA